VLPTLVLASIAALSLSVLILGWSIMSGRDRGQTQARTNLQRGLIDRPDSATELSGGAKGGQTEGLRLLVRRLTPNYSVRTLDRLLSRAGRPPAWPLHRLLAAKLVVPSILGALASSVFGASPGTLVGVVAIVVIVVSYFLPELLLHSRGQERAQKIGLELPDTLDQMTIAVEAGLGFDSAMSRAAKSGKGPLAQELTRTMQDMQVGQSRRTAYEALAARTGVPPLRKFVRAIIQADLYGIAIADVLRTQADELRIKRRQRAEEKAMQIPIKVIFPLMLCILPVLFIVLLGPAAMDIVAAFTK
jgi:tight adherence protein C